MSVSWRWCLQEQQTSQKSQEEEKFWSRHRMKQKLETQGRVCQGWWELRNERKSSRGDGAWLTTGAVVLTVRRTTAGRGGGAAVVGGIWRGKEGGGGGGGVPLGLLLSPKSPVGAAPVSLSVAVCPSPPPPPGMGPLPFLHMTAQKTTSRWLYSPSFVHFQHRDTRQIMLNDRRWLPEEWLLCCQCQVCKC